MLADNTLIIVLAMVAIVLVVYQVYFRKEQKPYQHKEDPAWSKKNKS